ncbi:MAG: hypothetical protein V9G12_12320 [Microthrixaceae bacterium]
MSFDTDWRFSTEHSRRIVRTLERAGVPVTFREISVAVGARLVPARRARLPRHRAGLVRPGAGEGLR